MYNISAFQSLGAPSPSGRGQGLLGKFLLSALTSEPDTSPTLDEASQLEGPDAGTGEGTISPDVQAWQDLVGKDPSMGSALKQLLGDNPSHRATLQDLLNVSKPNVHKRSL